LCKTDKLGDVTNGLRWGPVLKELMLRHGRTVAVRTHINSNKLKALGKNMALAKTQGKALGLTYSELALNI
jgi:hypothetical protein